MTWIIEGTWEEIKAHEAELRGHRLRVVIDPVEDEEDLTADIPPPPFSIKSREELVNSLLESVQRLDDGKGIEVDAAYGESKARIVADRLETQKPDS